VLLEFGKSWGFSDEFGNIRINNLCIYNNCVNLLYRGEIIEMTIENNLADKVLYSISIKDLDSTDKFYQEYLVYTRRILKKFDQDLQNKIMFKYAEFTKEMLR